jgi:hypothetical protein
LKRFAGVVLQLLEAHASFRASAGSSRVAEDIGFVPVIEPELKTHSGATADISC